MNSKEKFDNRKKPLWLIILFLIVCTFISLLITIAFFFSSEKYTITGPLLIMVCLLIVLVLSESFDSISVSSIFNAERNINPVSVFEANNEMARNELEKDPDYKLNSKRIDRKKFQNMILEKGLTNVKTCDILRDIKFGNDIQDNDEISIKPVFVDAYFKKRKIETFVLVLRTNFVSLIYHDRLYVLLNKILSYKKQNEANVKLCVIIAKQQGIEDKNSLTKLDDYFQPAIDSNLLEIKTVEYSEKECELCLKE